MADKNEQSRGLTVKVDVDVSEALTGLKAVQREAKKAAQALREVEAALEVEAEVYRVKEHASQPGVGVVINDETGTAVRFFNLSLFSTKSLYEELARRKGVKEHVVEPSSRVEMMFDKKQVFVEGPARILVNVD